MEDECKQLK